MIDKLIEQQEQIKAMQENEDSAIKVMKMYEDCKKRIDRAIEYIENTYIGSILEVHSGEEEEYTKPLLDILKGSDKE